MLNHTMNEEQIEWFKAGSALNLIALQKKKYYYFVIIIKRESNWVLFFLIFS